MTGSDAVDNEASVITKFQKEDNFLLWGMNQYKTRPTSASVHSYIQKIIPEQKQLDCRTLDSMMERIRENKATLWRSTLSVIVTITTSTNMAARGIGFYAGLSFENKL